VDEQHKMLPQICRINWGNRQSCCPCSAVNLSAAGPGAKFLSSSLHRSWRWRRANGQWAALARGVAASRGRRRLRQCGIGGSGSLAQAPNGVGVLEIWGVKLGPCWALGLIHCLAELVISFFATRCSRLTLARCHVGLSWRSGLCSAAGAKEKEGV
jgi:hypothetical protein